MKKQQNKVVKSLSEKKVTVLLARYSDTHQSSSNQLINWICIPLMLLSIIGLTWAIPFPHLGFLGRYNGFVNWASFLIAFSGYYYYRLSPVLSYMIILLFFAIALVVVQLEKWSLAGGPALWLICWVIFILAWTGQFIGQKIEGKRLSLRQQLIFLLIGPVWLLEKLAIKIGLKLN